MYTVTQIDYFAISKSNALALVMAASDGEEYKGARTKQSCCFGRVCGGEEDHGGEEGHAQGSVGQVKERGNGWPQ